MRGIILGYRVYGSEHNELNVGDLVCFDDGYDDSFRTIAKINPRFMKNEGEPDQPNMYFIRVNWEDRIIHDENKMMNFARCELTKCDIAFFDRDKYFQENKKIFIGHLQRCDIDHVKCKKLFELDLGMSDIGSITKEDLLNMEFDGETVTKDEPDLVGETVSTSKQTKYFAISRKH